MMIFNIIILTISIAYSASTVFAIDYYIDDIKGNDNASGLSPCEAWKAINKVNGVRLRGGDNIYLRRNGVWNEEMNFTSVGGGRFPITVTTYGQGLNPKIVTTKQYSDWKLMPNKNGKKIWKGEVVGIKNYFGAIKGKHRIPVYNIYNKHYLPVKNFYDIENGFLFAPKNSSVFYYRSDSGKPEEIKIGVLRRGIHIYKCQNIIINGIDFDGPSGGSEYVQYKNSSLVLIEDSNNVIVRNCKISRGNLIGIQVKNNSNNITFDNVISFGHGSTGLSVSNSGNNIIIEKCKIYDCGNIITDSGDMGLVGVWKTPYVVVRDSVFYNNGHFGVENIDAAISFVQSPNGKVMRCNIHNVGGTAVQFSENSDNGLVAYSIIVKWGIYKTDRKNEGIRIGGGIKSSSAKSCKIYNNLFSNQFSIEGNWAAIKILYHENSGIEIKNNIFYMNDGIYDLIAESKDHYKDWVISNNVYYRKNGNSIMWNRKVYSYDHVIGHREGYYSYDTKQDNNSIFKNPKLTIDRHNLNIDSPCIDHGIHVGLERDYYNNYVPLGKQNDIGPYEYPH